MCEIVGGFVGLYWCEERERERAVSFDVHWIYLQSKTIYKVDYAITK